MNLKRTLFYSVLLNGTFFLPGHAWAASVHAQPLPVPAESADAASERFDFADGLYARDMYDMAAAEYQTLIQTYPGHPRVQDALYRLAESLFMMKRFPEALDSYGKLLNQYPSHPRAETAALRRAEALFETGSRQEALRLFQGLTKSDSPFVRQSAHYFAGRILFEEESFQEAQLHFHAVQAPGEENPYREIALYHLGRIALEQKQFANAVSFFEKMTASENAEMRALGFFGVGQSSFLSDNFAHAAEAFEKAYESTASKELRRDAYLNKLKALYERKEYDEVIRGYEQAPFRDSDEAMLPLKLLSAHAGYKTGAHEKAVRLFDEILALPGLDPENREIAELGKIESLLAGGDSLGALEVARAMLQERAFHKDRWAYLMAEALKRTGHSAEALDLYETFLENFPDSQYVPQIYLNRAQILIQMNKSLEARNAIDAFLRAFPDHPLTKETVLNRIAMDIRLEEWQAAITTSLAFLQRFGETAEAEDVHFQLGSLYLQTEEYGKAFQTFQNHFARADLSSFRRQETLFFMGYSRQLAGSLEEAVKYYERLDEKETPEELFYASLRNLAYAFIRLEELDQATVVYKKMIAKFPAKELSWDVYFWLADYYLKRGDGKSILTVLRHLEVKEDEDSPGELHYYLAEGYRLTGEWDQAVKHYDMALTFGSSLQPNVRLGKGTALARMKRFDEAQAELEAAVREAAEDYAAAMQARMELAEVALMQNKFLEAGKGYMAVAILYDDAQTVPLALQKAAEAFRSAGRSDEARKAEEELVSRYPAHPFAKEITPGREQSAP